MRTATTRKDGRRSPTTAARTGTTADPGTGPGATTHVRGLPTPAQLQLPASPVPERQRATVTAAALRATIEEWLQEADGTGPRALSELAAAARVRLDVVKRCTQRSATGAVPAGLAARLLWAMGEPLRPDLRQALADDLAAEAASASTPSRVPAPATGRAA